MEIKEVLSGFLVLVILLPIVSIIFIAYNRGRKAEHSYSKNKNDIAFIGALPSLLIFMVTAFGSYFSSPDQTSWYAHPIIGILVVATVNALYDTFRLVAREKPGRSRIILILVGILVLLSRIASYLQQQ